MFLLYLMFSRLLYGFFCCHVTAGIEGVSRRSKIYVKCWLDSHAKCNDRTDFKAHRTSTCARIFLLTPIMMTWWIDAINKMNRTEWIIEFKIFHYKKNHLEGWIHISKEIVSTTKSRRENKSLKGKQILEF